MDPYLLDPLVRDPFVLVPFVPLVLGHPETFPGVILVAFLVTEVEKMSMLQVLVRMVVLLHLAKIFDQQIEQQLVLEQQQPLALLGDVESCLLALPSLLGSSEFVASAVVVACPPDPAWCPGQIGHCTHSNLVLNYLKSVTQCPKKGLV